MPQGVTSVRNFSRFQFCLELYPQPNYIRNPIMMLIPNLTEHLTKHLTLILILLQPLPSVLPRPLLLQFNPTPTPTPDPDSQPARHSHHYPYPTVRIQSPSCLTLWMSSSNVEARSGLELGLKPQVSSIKAQASILNPNLTASPIHLSWAYPTVPHTGEFELKLSYPNTPLVREECTLASKGQTFNRHLYSVRVRARRLGLR